MLIPSTPQNAVNVAAYSSSVTPTGVEQGVTRADIPPVNETSKDAGSQNKLFSQTLPQPVSGAPNQAAAAQSETDSAESDGAQSAATDSSDARKTSDKTINGNGVQQLAEEDIALIEQLRARDREVRVHEAAHASVGGRYAGTANFQYTRGPDGKNYATGGEVSISTGAVSGDPQATIEKARVIRAAALAPAEPSTQDRRVAAEAAQMELSARADLQAMQAEEKARDEAAKAEKEEKSRADEGADESAAAEEADSQPVTTEVSIAPVVTASSGSDSSDSEEDGDSAKAAQAEPRPNARQELEKILLGSTGILQQANQQGLVDPQNPYGRSGFLDVIA